jgi:hypothetical protein
VICWAPLVACRRHSRGGGLGFAQGRDLEKQRGGIKARMIGLCQISWLPLPCRTERDPSSGRLAEGLLMNV